MKSLQKETSPSTIREELQEKQLLGLEIQKNLTTTILLISFEYSLTFLNLLQS